MPVPLANLEGASREIGRSLRETGSYSTHPDLRAVGIDRLMRRFDWWLGARVVFTTLHGHWIARRGRYDLDEWSRHSGRITRTFEYCGLRMTIEGMAPLLRHDGPVVYAANHMSMLETLILPTVTLNQGSVSFVVKRSLLRYPCFGRILNSVDPIAVGRSNPRDDLKAVLDQGLQRIGMGRSVLVFPQATRMPVFDPAHFNTLAVKLARRAGVPVVGLALKTDFLGVGKWLRDFGPVDRSKRARFRFSEPLRVDGNGRDTHAHIVEFITDSLREWGGQVVEKENRS